MLSRMMTALGAGGPAADSRMTVLNVGGGDKTVAIPAHYDGWRQTLLDVNPAADIVADARKLHEVVPDGSCDAVYCSHNLEHYYQHEVPQMLASFARALKPGGFAEIRVPDIGGLIGHLASSGADINAAVYDSPSGPITAHDMFYGFGAEIRNSGKDYYAHKTGFSQASLSAALFENGFPVLCFAPPLSVWELHVFAFKQQPDEAITRQLGLTA